MVLLVACGCSVSPQGITFNVPKWNIPTVVPPRPQPEAVYEPGKMRCLIIEDNSDSARSKLTPIQSSILFATGAGSVKQFLSENCIESKNAEGAIDQGWVQIDKDATLPGDWAALKSKHPPQSYPWMILANGDHSDGFAITDYPTSLDRKSTRLNSSHVSESRMPSSA